MNTVSGVNGGCREVLAAISQDIREERKCRRERARERKEIARRNREIERRKAREEKKRGRQFAGRVTFCDCGFRRIFGIRIK